MTRAAIWKRMATLFKARALAKDKSTITIINAQLKLCGTYYLRAKS